MQHSIKFPILKRLLLIQFSLALIGAVSLYAVFHKGSQDLAEKEFEFEKQKVISELSKVQDQWRAWKELGLYIPLQKELDYTRKKFGLRSLDLLKAKELQDHSYDIVIPKIEKTEFSDNQFYVVVEIKQKSFLQIVQSRKDVLLVASGLMLIFWSIAYFSILFLQKKIHKPIIQLIENMQQSLEPENSPIKELQASGEMKLFVDQISNLQKKTKDMERAATLGVLTAQVSHDLMSPIASLEMLLKESSIKGEEHELLQASIQRIRDISRTLLQTKSAPQATSGFSYVAKEIKQSIELKKLETKATRISIKFDYDQKLDRLLVNINQIVLSRIISNLLNNSIESYGERAGEITVSLLISGPNYKICIKDKGCGISEEVLSKIGHFGATFNKENGSGIGIHHAKTTLESIGGELEIFSLPDVGTEVTMIVPGKIQSF